MDTSNNLIFLYELPKETVTSNLIAEKIKELTGYELTEKPQIRRTILAPFYTGIVKIADHNKFKEICDKIKYFELDGKMCRAIPFSKDLKGVNREKINKECNLFVKDIGKISHKELE